LLGRSEPLDPDTLPSLSPEALAAAIPDRATRETALRFLVAAALHEGALVSRRLVVAREIAAAWSLTVGQVEQVAVLVETRLEEMIADAMRPDRHALGTPFDTALAAAALRRYENGHADPALVARYRALAVRPPHTFGRAFHNLYETSRFSFPGEPGALDEAAAAPHDSAHVLAGYATSLRGELLLATFNAAMRGDDDVAGFALTVLSVWHWGLYLDEHNEAGGTWLELEPFAVAWERGRAARVDLYGEEFAFWDNVDRDLDELRRWAGIGPPQLRADNGHGIIRRS
jgi:hypothetical protein